MFSGLLTWMMKNIVFVLILLIVSRWINEPFCVLIYRSACLTFFMILLVLLIIWFGALCCAFHVGNRLEESQMGPLLYLWVRLFHIPFLSCHSFIFFRIDSCIDLYFLPVKITHYRKLERKYFWNQSIGVFGMLFWMDHLFLLTLLMKWRNQSLLRNELLMKIGELNMMLKSETSYHLL